MSDTTAFWAEERSRDEDQRKDLDLFFERGHAQGVVEERKRIVEALRARDMRNGSTAGWLRVAADDIEAGRL